MQSVENNPSIFVHRSSYIDENVQIGDNTKIWHIIDAAQACGAKYKERFNCIVMQILLPLVFFRLNLSAVMEMEVQYAEKIKSLRVHGKGIDKYDNIYIGMNSRLDTIQATILKEKLIIYNQEIVQRNKVANFYN